MACTVPVLASSFSRRSRYPLARVDFRLKSPPISISKQHIKSDEKHQRSQNSFKYSGRKSRRSSVQTIGEPNRSSRCRNDDPVSHRIAKKQKRSQKIISALCGNGKKHNDHRSRTVGRKNSSDHPHKKRRRQSPAFHFRQGREHEESTESRPTSEAPSGSSEYPEVYERSRNVRSHVPGLRQ